MENWNTSNKKYLYIKKWGRWFIIYGLIIFLIDKISEFIKRRLNRDTSQQFGYVIHGS